MKIRKINEAFVKLNETELPTEFPIRLISVDEKSDDDYVRASDTYIWNVRNFGSTGGSPLYKRYSFEIQKIDDNYMKWHNDVTSEDLGKFVIIKGHYRAICKPFVVDTKEELLQKAAELVVKRNRKFPNLEYDLPEFEKYFAPLLERKMKQAQEREAERQEREAKRQEMRDNARKEVFKNLPKLNSDFLWCTEFDMEDKTNLFVVYVTQYGVKDGELSAYYLPPKGFLCGDTLNTALLDVAKKYGYGIWHLYRTRIFKLVDEDPKALNAKLLQFLKEVKEKFEHDMNELHQQAKTKTQQYKTDLNNFHVFEG